MIFRELSSSLGLGFLEPHRYLEGGSVLRYGVPTWVTVTRIAAANVYMWIGLVITFVVLSQSGSCGTIRILMASGLQSKGKERRETRHCCSGKYHSEMKVYAAMKQKIDLVRMKS